MDGIMEEQQSHAARTLQDWGKRLPPPDDPFADGELEPNTLFHLDSDLELYTRTLGALVDGIREVDHGKDGS